MEGRVGEAGHQVAGVRSSKDQAAAQPHSPEHPLPQCLRQGGGTLAHQGTLQLQPQLCHPALYVLMPVAALPDVLQR